ncbi:hypothetical protein EI77_03855 [Prosthecobacter fusiformis]|uniref:Uncharacterized protein n=1 Tax=Prosthecobacter fusiformis TaxID=48464 RepID=A0A4R7RMV0_9BACT|nr:hypothetical protein EI77_03855 [Prosthecobacter fusiformis]
MGLLSPNTLDTDQPIGSTIRLVGIHALALRLRLHPLLQLCFCSKIQKIF